MLGEVRRPDGRPALEGARRVAVAGRGRVGVVGPQDDDLLLGEPLPEERAEHRRDVVGGADVHEQLPGVRPVVEAPELHPHPGQLARRDRAALLPRGAGDHPRRRRGHDLRAVAPTAQRRDGVGQRPAPVAERGRGGPDLPEAGLGARQLAGAEPRRRAGAEAGGRGVDRAVRGGHGGPGRRDRGERRTGQDRGGEQGGEQGLQHPSHASRELLVTTPPTPGDPRVTWRHDARDLRRGPRGFPRLGQGVPGPRGGPPPRRVRRGTRPEPRVLARRRQAGLPRPGDPRAVRRLRGGRLPLQRRAHRGAGQGQHDAALVRGHPRRHRGAVPRPPHQRRAEGALAAPRSAPASCSPPSA